MGSLPALILDNAFSDEQKHTTHKKVYFSAILLMFSGPHRYPINTYYIKTEWLSKLHSH